MGPQPRTSTDRVSPAPRTPQSRGLSCLSWHVGACPWFTSVSGAESAPRAQPCPPSLRPELSPARRPCAPAQPCLLSRCPCAPAQPCPLSLRPVLSPACRPCAPAQPCPLSLCPQGLFSSVVCPGTMLTNLTYGILPRFVWTLIMPIIWLVSAPRPVLPFSVYAAVRLGTEGCVRAGK